MGLSGGTQLGSASWQERQRGAIRDKTAAVEDAIESLLEIKRDIGRILILYESLDGKRLGCVDSSLTPEQVLMMIELFKQ